MTDFINSFWGDHETITLFHGTSLQNWKRIQKQGLTLGEDGKIYFSTSKTQAFGYAGMGGEAQYIKAKQSGESVERIADHDRVVIAVTLPTDKVKLNGGGHFKTRERFESIKHLVIENFGNNPDELQLEFSTNEPVEPQYIERII